jgi:hypothetical protein
MLLRYQNYHDRIARRIFPEWRRWMELTEQQR